MLLLVQECWILKQRYIKKGMLISGVFGGNISIAVADLCQLFFFLERLVHFKMKILS